MSVHRALVLRSWDFWTIFFFSQFGMLSRIHTFWPKILHSAYYCLHVLGESFLHVMKWYKNFSVFTSCMMSLLLLALPTVISEFVRRLSPPLMVSQSAILKKFLTLPFRLFPESHPHFKVPALIIHVIYQKIYWS